MAKRSVDKTESRPLSKKGPSEDGGTLEHQDENVDHGRRGLIMAGIAIVAVATVLGVSIATKDEPPKSPTGLKGKPRPKKPEYMGPVKDLFSSPRLEGQDFEYLAWASKIEIPKIEIGDSLGWNEEQKNEYFLPEDIDKTVLDSFYKEFDEMIKYLEQNLGKTRDPKKREELKGAFIVSLGLAFNEDIKKEKQGRMIQLDILALNRVLVPHGYWIQNETDEAGRMNFIVYKVSDIKGLNVSAGGKDAQVPLVLMKSKSDFALDPQQKKLHFKAHYLPYGNYVVADEDSENILHNLRKYNDLYRDGGAVQNHEGLRKQYIDATIQHEGEHAGLVNVDGVLTDYELIGGQGIIHMGSYLLREDDYKWHSHSELHELAGLGRELMNLEEPILSPRMMSIISSTGLKGAQDERMDYDFAAFILLYELAYALEAEEYGRFVKAFKEKGYDMGQLIADLPEAKKKEIGKRMLKLAHRLKNPSKK